MDIKNTLIKTSTQQAIEVLEYGPHEELSVLLDCMEEEIYVCDIKTYEIVFINKVFLKKYGNITGKTCYESIYKGQKEPCSFCTNKLFLYNDKKEENKRKWIFKKENAGSWYERQDIAARWDNGRAVKISIINQIKDYKELETTLFYELKIERLLYDITKKFINIHTNKIDEYIVLCMKELGAYINAKRGFVYLLVENGTKLKLTHIWDDSQQTKELSFAQSELTIEQCHFFLETFAKGEVFSTYDNNADEKLKQCFEAHSKTETFINGYTVIAPIDSENSVIGFTGFTSINDSSNNAYTLCQAVSRIGEILSHGLKRKVSQGKIEHLAHYDSLTNVLNRTLFSDRFKSVINQSKRYNWTTALLFLDLDGFKQVNDKHGHDYGDFVLKETAMRLKGCIRESDTIGRMGGDEFTIVLPNLVRQKDAANVCQKIIDAVSKPYVINTTSCSIGVSIGVSIYPSNGQNNDSLLKCADIAMYQAKLLGKNNFQFYNPRLKTEAIEELNNKRRLKNAIDRNELIVHYQPQFDINTGKIVGAEALVRWFHPDMGVIFPENFIKEAINAGLIMDIDSWIIKRSCRQNQQWQKDGLPQLNINVNISCKHIKERKVVSQIEQTLQETALNPQFLIAELSEVVMVQNDTAVINALGELKKMGIKISIDDFGLSYNTLRHLKELPIDFLKIDPLFVQRCTNNSYDASIARAIIAMAHSLGLKVIAVGIETEEQFDLIRLLRCDIVQGYLFSNPMPADKFHSFLTSRFFL